MAAAICPPMLSPRIVTRTGSSALAYTPPKSPCNGWCSNPSQSSPSPCHSSSPRPHSLKFACTVVDCSHRPLVRQCCTRVSRGLSCRCICRSSDALQRPACRRRATIRRDAVPIRRAAPSARFGAFECAHSKEGSIRGFLGVGFARERKEDQGDNRHPSGRLSSLSCSCSGAYGCAPTYAS